MRATPPPPPPPHAHRLVTHTHTVRARRVYGVSHKYRRRSPRSFRPPPIVPRTSEKKGFIKNTLRFSRTYRLGDVSVGNCFKGSAVGPVLTAKRDRKRPAPYPTGYESIEMSKKIEDMEIKRRFVPGLAGPVGRADRSIVDVTERSRSRAFFVAQKRSRKTRTSRSSTPPPCYVKTRRHAKIG